MIHNIKKYLEFKGTISGGDYIAVFSGTWYNNTFTNTMVLSSNNL